MRERTSGHFAGYAVDVLRPTFAVCWFYQNLPNRVAEQVNRRRRLMLAAVRRRNIRTAQREIQRVLWHAEKVLLMAHPEFVFLCPRCAQRYSRRARLQITPQTYGLHLRHESPPCDAFPLPSGRGSFMDWLRRGAW